MCSSDLYGTMLLAVAIGYGIFGYIAAGSIVAAASGARRIEKAEHPELWNSVENAAIAAGLAKTPDVYIIEDPAPNAFAAGRTPNSSYVAATTGILALLDKRELEGVMAHEMAHVRNRDVRLMTLAAVLVGVISMVADMLMWSLWLGGGRTLWTVVGARARTRHNKQVWATCMALASEPARRPLLGL